MSGVLYGFCMDIMLVHTSDVSERADLFVPVGHIYCTEVPPKTLRWPV